MFASFVWFCVCIALAVTPLCLLLVFRLVLRIVQRQLGRVHATAQDFTAVERISRTTKVVIPVTGGLTVNRPVANRLLVGRTVYDLHKKLNKKELSPVGAAAALGSGHAALKSLGESIGGYEDHRLVRHFKAGSIYRRGDQLVAYTTGPLETILSRSSEIWDHGHVRKLGPRDEKALQAFGLTTMHSGDQTTAIAFRILPDMDESAVSSKLLAEKLTLLGAVSLHDPLRRSTLAAARTLDHAQVSLCIVDDNPAIARVAAQQAGILKPQTMTPIQANKQHGHRTFKTTHSLQDTASAIRMSRQALIHIRSILRVSFVSSTAQTLAVVGGIIAFVQYQVAPVIMPWQLMLVELALVLPLVSTAHDRSHSQVMRRPPSNVSGNWARQAYSPGIFGFGTVAASLALASYGFFFVRHNLSPRFLESTLPMYQQATTLTALTLILCLYAHLLFERSDHHEHFFTDHLAANKRLLIAFGLSLAVFCTAAYTTVGQTALGTAGPDLTDWASAIFAAGLYACARLVQRHTRRHTRMEVIKLHHQTR